MCLVEMGRTHWDWTLAHGAPREPGFRTRRRPWSALQGEHCVNAFSLAGTTGRALAGSEREAGEAGLRLEGKRAWSQGNGHQG